MPYAITKLPPLIAFWLGIFTASQLAYADELTRHFFGEAPTCRTNSQPVILVADLTLSGEIDDSVSLYMFRQLERLGCVRVLAVVSILGNGRSSTAAIHGNLSIRLPALIDTSWSIMRGPDVRYTTKLNRQRETVADVARLDAIAEIITSSTRPVVMVELGPFTVSARLLADSYVPAEKINRILGVGGRINNESFATDRRLGRLFAFRDMNVAEDVKAIDYLIRYHGEKLWLVTYRTGIGSRQITAAMVAEALLLLANHSHERARTLYLIGFSGIPSWDTWTTAYFLRGRAEWLGCQPHRALVRAVPRGRDRVRLLYGQQGFRLTACAEVATP